ncbi:MAG: DUF4349 domain-containing protein [Solirubrobacteraceae bacterium]
MKPPEDTATIERDLQAVDAALAGGAARHDDPVARELQELALALRADTPVAEPAFAHELRGRAEAGFPGAQKRRLPRLRLAPVAAVLAPSLLVVALVFAAGGPSLSGGGSGDSGGGSVAEAPSAGGDSGGGAEAARDAPAASATDALSQPPNGPGTGFAPGRRERRIERSISMTLMAPDDEIPQAADDVNRVTARHGGFVLRSELDTGEGGSTGSFELRIPSGRLQGALRDLRLRTEYAIVSVDLIGDEDGDSGSSGGGAFDDAVGDAGDLLVGFAGVLIRVLAIALPLGLIALIAWLAGSGLRRRRRESALA